MKIVIKGKPTPLQRHRQTRNGVVYDPQKDEKQSVYWLMRKEIMNQCQGLLVVPHRKSIKVHFDFFMPVPSSLSLIKKNELMGTPHCKKPDIDNLIKFYLDVGTTLLWDDDSNISTLSSRKVYDKEPRVEITIEKL